MMPYTVEPALLSTKDSFWPTAPQNTTYYKIERGSSYSNYVQPNSLGGISIELYAYTFTTHRRVYSIIAWLANVGGMLKLIRFIFLIFAGFFKRVLHDNLVSKLYKQTLN